MKLDAIVWWDEKHQKIHLGCSSKHEVIVSRDTVGTPMKLEEGGEFPDRMPSTQVKFPKEARMCFGLGMRTTPDGECEGVKALPFEYTSLKVIGPTKFKAEFKAEVLRVKGMKGCWSTFPNGYEQRYPETWPLEVAHALKRSRKIICITDIMVHVVRESTRIYEGVNFY